MPIVTRNDPLSGVESKVFSGERLSLADGLALLESPDLMRIGHLADRERKRIVGDSVYFNCNRHINYTNICRNRCDFCAFSRDVGEEGAFTLRPEEILEKASEALDYGVTELHIVGGEHPNLPYEEVRRMIVDLENGSTLPLDAGQLPAHQVVVDTDGYQTCADQSLLRCERRGWNGGGGDHHPHGWLRLRCGREPRRVGADY